jgi:hypothetical protein
MNKKEWLDEYKKLNSTYRIEEKNIIHSYLSEDFHLNKIFSTLLKEEVENESKILIETIKSLKNSIGDVYSFFKGNISSNLKIRNYDIRGKIYKIEEAISKNRIDFKNKFEGLMMDEEQLERELMEFEENLNFEKIMKNREDLNLEDGENFVQENLNFNHAQDNTKLIFSKNLKNFEKIDEFISTVMSNVHTVYDESLLEEVFKIISRLQFNDTEEIRIKISQIDIIIEKNLGGANLTWQTRDHQEFLKLRAGHNLKINTFQFLNDLENILPFIPRSELKNHIVFYNKFYQLNELKKSLICKYKEIKKEKEDRGKREILEKLEEKKTKQENNTNNSNRPYSSNNIICKKSLEEKQKLEEWKKKKLQEKREKYEEELRIEQEIKEKERMKYLERSSVVKPMIEEYKKVKIVQEINKTNSELNPSIKVSEIDMERIKEKSEKIVQKKMLIVKSKSLNMIKKAESYTKYKIKKMDELDKIQPQLLVKTENFENKQRKKFDKSKDHKKDAFTMANNVLGRMTRAVPQWRKGLI